MDSSVCFYMNVYVHIFLHSKERTAVGNWFWNWFPVV